MTKRTLWGVCWWDWWWWWCMLGSFFVLEAQSAKKIPLSHVQAVIKGTVSLPCDIALPDPPKPHDEVLLVLWYREDLGTPIYSVDARERPFQEAERWSDENVFGNRAYFRSTTLPASLAIENVQDGDAGVYRCRVDFKEAQTRNSKVNLTVIVPPKNPVITDDSGIDRSLFVGPYTEGATLILHCEVMGGKPVPSVNWYRNSEIVDSSWVEARENVVRNDLTLHHLGRGDLHAELTCEASNNNISRPVTATVHVDMNFSPLEVRLLGKGMTLTASRKYDLLCEAVGSRPPAHITWWKDGKRLEGGKETTSKDGNTTTSTLSFVPHVDDMAKYLSCRAENPIIPSSSLEDGWKLEIQYTPEAQLMLGPSLSPDSIREGSDVYFDCKIKANPLVYKVDWKHNGRLLAHNISAGVIMTNQSLVLQKVNRQSTGNYTCVGHNTEGDGESNPFYLDVLYAPACKPQQSRVHGVAKLEHANISCEVEANPSNVTFRWTFNNSAESTDIADSRFRTKGSRSVVTYVPMTEMDYGTLLCWSHNLIGSQTVPCVFHIIAAGRPDPVHNCTVVNQSVESFHLHCSEGFNGGLPQSFGLEVYESQTHQLKANITSSVPRFSVNGLEAGMGFLAYAYAFNAKGRGESAIVQVFTLRLPEKQLTTEKEKPRAGFPFTPLVSILVGVVAALVVVAVVVLVVLRLQCSHEDKRKGDVGLGGRDKASTPLKLDPGEGVDSDEKNPDIIPQPNDPEEHEFFRKRQHISTIETSPTRLHPTALAASYCTLRNGIPLQDLNSIGSKPKMKEEGMPTYPACTLPRPHWTAYSAGGGGGGHGGRRGPTALLYSTVTHEGTASLPTVECLPPPGEDEQATAETPLMVAKRESTV